MPGKKKAGAKRTAKPPEPRIAHLAVSPLADLTDSLVCDCLGETITAINSTGFAMLGFKRAAKTKSGGTPIGQSLGTVLTDATGKPLKSIAALLKGSPAQTRHAAVWPGSTR